MKNVRRIREQVRAQVLADVCSSQLGKVFLELALRRAPREVGVRLREARLREIPHDLRPCERLREKNGVRMGGAKLAERPFPEVKRLRVRIVHAENLHALRDPEFDDAFQLAPERRPLRRFEIERIDVLVFLRRIFRVLDRPVRPMPKPGWMRLHVGVIRRGLKRDVQRNFEALRGGGFHEMREVGERTQPGLDRRVASFVRTYGPGAAGVTRRRGQRIVPALAEAAADRMNRRQIQHIESHRPDVREPCFCVPEACAARRVAAAGSRKHFVPRAEPGALAIDGDLEDARVPRAAAAAVVRGQHRLFEPLAGYVLSGRHLLLEPLAPRRAPIDPGHAGSGDAIRGGPQR